MIERDEGESPSNLLPTSSVYPDLIAGQVSFAAISLLLRIGLRHGERGDRGPLVTLRRRLVSN